MNTEYSYRIGHKVPDYDLNTGLYGSQWGVSDLYQESSTMLHELLDSGDDFHASWESKKELLGAEILCVDDTMTIKVHAWMDDLWEEGDLIYDAYYDATGREVELPDSLMDEIRDYSSDCEIDDTAIESWTGHRVDYDDVMDILNKLATAADARCHQMYHTLVDIVKECVTLN